MSFYKHDKIYSHISKDLDIPVSTISHIIKICIKDGLEKKKKKKKKKCSVLRAFETFIRYKINLRIG